jgi:multiple sugar transport system permease protein
MAGMLMTDNIRLHGRMFGNLSVLPFIFLVLGLGGYALIQVVHMAFSHVRIVGGAFVWSFAGASNFAEVAANPIARNSVLITAVFVAATSATSVVLGTCIALLVQQSSRLKRLAQVVLVWPTVVAPVVISLIWLLILSPNIGSLNKVLGTLGLPTQDWLGTPTGALIAIILVDIWHWTPVAFLLIYTALCGLDEDAAEAARCDGATEMQIVWLIKLPLLFPAIASALFIRAVMGVKAFDEMYLLTAGGPDNATTLVSLHIRDVFFDQLNLGYGAAFSVVVVVLLAGITAALFAGGWVARQAQFVRSAPV